MYQYDPGFRVIYALSQKSTLISVCRAKCLVFGPRGLKKQHVMGDYDLIYAEITLVSSHAPGSFPNSHNSPIYFCAKRLILI